MTHYIDKDALVAMIKSRMATNKHENPFAAVAYVEDEDILDAIDTLEVKEVDLDEEIEKCLKKHNMLAVGKKDFTDIAKYFFELGLRSTITEEDCKLIWNIGDDLPYMSEEEFFKELLRRYKAQKGE